MPVDLSLQFPSGLLYLVEHDVWARVHGDGTATVGITALRRRE
jgi:glycine cleavage system H lipoate-binding protein